MRSSASLKLVARAGAALVAIACAVAAPAQRSDSAQPNLGEIWARVGCTGGQPCPFIPTELPLKARAIGFI